MEFKLACLEHSLAGQMLALHLAISISLTGQEVDISISHWKDICLGYNWSRRTVTIMRLTYLLCTRCRSHRPLQQDHSTHTHTCLTTLCLGLCGWAGTRKVKPVWILLKQETVSGNGIRWAICKSTPRSRQITTPAPHCSVFYRPDALPATQLTVSKRWRQNRIITLKET